MITLINTTTQESRESVCFQPVLKAHPTCHPWIITGHVLLGNLEKLNSLNSIYTSYQLLILAASQLLKKEPSCEGYLVSNKNMTRSLLPFFGNALSWLTEQPKLRMLTVLKQKSTN